MHFTRVCILFPTFITFENCINTGDDGVAKKLRVDSISQTLVESSNSEMGAGASMTGLSFNQKANQLWSKKQVLGSRLAATNLKAARRQVPDRCRSPLRRYRGSIADSLWEGLLSKANPALYSRVLRSTHRL